MQTEPRMKNIKMQTEANVNVNAGELFEFKEVMK